MHQKISTTWARLDDAAAMVKFLSPIPNADQLVKVLKRGEPLSTRAYDDAAGIARFVESDGDRVMCFTVLDITIDQAEMIEAEYENAGSLGETAFLEAIHRAIGLDPQA